MARKRRVLLDPGSRKKYSRKSASDLALVQPWFLPRRTSQQILQLLPAEWKRRMRYCFDDYGCLRCDRKDIPHLCCGFCDKCGGMVLRRLKFTVRKHFKRPVDSDPLSGSSGFLVRANLAQKLLSGISEGRPKPSRKSPEKHLGFENPLRQLSGMPPRRRR